MGLSTAAIATEQTQQVLRIQTSEKATFSNKSIIEDWFQQSPFFMLKSQSSFDFPNFPETDKIFQVWYFQLNQDYQSQKSLFNGLILLGQPQGIVLEYQKDLNTYAFKYYEHDGEKALMYMKKLHQLLSNELRFKRLLSSYLLEEKRHHQSQSLLQRELFSR